ncbi:MAG: hypothetical protein ACTHNM_13385 [Dyella sp.]|uniref:hypothetical protein n=1 Tax=Dyella sp. TaxID=1869338 RepID=UPI003F7E7611
MTTALSPAARAAALTLLLAGTGLAAAQTPTPDAGIRQLEGTAYATGDGHVMYRESHWLFDDAQGPARLVLYRCPDGRAFARKALHDDGYAQAPDFELVDGRTGYREGVRRVGDQRVVFVRANTTAAERSKPLDTTPLPVIDAGFDAYIRSHWDRLGRGDSDTVPFVIPSRLGTLKFSVKRVDDAVVEGRPARQYRLSLASWIGFALPHIDVAYDARSRSLLRFVGLANVHASNGDNVRARIEFNPADERPATPTDLMQARQAPLDGRCPIP